MRVSWAVVASLVAVRYGMAGCGMAAAVLILVFVRIRAPLWLFSIRYHARFLGRSAEAFDQIRGCLVLGWLSQRFPVEGARFMTQAGCVEAVAPGTGCESKPVLTYALS